MAQGSLSSKKLEEISSEDLLKALESPQQTIEIQDTPDFVKFIQRFDIKSGKHPIHPRLLFQLFKKYYHYQESLSIFIRMAKTLLKHHQRHFYLNSDCLLLFHELNAPKKRSVQTRSATSNSGLQRHLNAFFEATGLSEGTTKTPWYVLYHLYRCYCIDNNRKSHHTAKVFLSYLKLHFTHFSTNDGLVFNISTAEGILPNKGEYDQIRKIYQKKKPKK
jgi:hypothetical protein